MISLKHEGTCACLLRKYKTKIGEQWRGIYIILVGQGQKQASVNHEYICMIVWVKKYTRIYQYTNIPEYIRDKSATSISYSLVGIKLFNYNCTLQQFDIYEFRLKGFRETSWKSIFTEPLTYQQIWYEQLTCTKTMLSPNEILDTHRSVMELFSIIPRSTIMTP